MLVKIERRFCDLCWSEDGRYTLATHHYAHPTLLEGLAFDGCRKHTDQMRDAGGYTITPIKPATDFEITD